MPIGAKIKIIELSITGVVLGILLTEAFRMREVAGVIAALQTHVEMMELACKRSAK